MKKKKKTSKVQAVDQAGIQQNEPKNESSKLDVPKSSKVLAVPKVLAKKEAKRKYRSH